MAFAFIKHDTHIDFIGKQHIAYAVSALLLLVGLQSSSGQTLAKQENARVIRNRAGEDIAVRYILVRRVALAKSLLAQGYTVAETCHLSGFNDYSNFIRTFKKVTGATPGKFRRPL